MTVTAMLPAEIPSIRRLAYQLPASTPAQGAMSNFADPAVNGAKKFSSNRPFKRTHSDQENETVLLKHLKDYWGYDEFREHQMDICVSALRDRDILMVAPTGLGKSLCFQLPAITLEYGITIVIAPIKSLMHDQVNDLQERGVEAMLACRDTTPEDYKRIQAELRMGHPTLRLLYITPESLFTGRYMPAIRIAYGNRQIRRLVVDEAHCIDEWGSSFRKTYRALGEFRSAFPTVPTSAFTASATKATRKDILQTLRINKKNLDMWVLPVNRPNIFYEVVYRGPDSAHAPTDQYIADYIKRYTPEALRRNRENGVSASVVTGIVYCRLVKECDEVSMTLRAAGISARPFHAQLSDGEKAEVLRKWKEGTISCVCATVAFGMGIDQSHVRYVIHYNLPKSFEGFYQETGRAGRDRHASRCVLIYSRKDAQNVLGSIKLDRQKEAYKLQHLNPNDREQVAASESRLAAYGRQLRSAKKLQRCFAENVRQCRHVSVCNYFEEEVDQSKEGWKEAYCSGMCDVCTSSGVVLRNYSLIDEDIDMPSQYEEPIELANGQEDEESESEDNDPSSEISIDNSLRIMHGRSSSGNGPYSFQPRSSITQAGNNNHNPSQTAESPYLPSSGSSRGPRRAGLGRQPIGRSALGFVSPLVPVPASAEHASLQGVGVDQSREEDTRDLIGSTQEEAEREVVPHVKSDLEDLNASGELPALLPSSGGPAAVPPAVIVPPSSTSQGHNRPADVPQRRRMGLTAMPSGSDIGSNSDGSTLPNLALRSPDIGPSRRRLPFGGEDDSDSDDAADEAVGPATLSNAGASSSSSKQMAKMPVAARARRPLNALSSDNTTPTRLTRGDFDGNAKAVQTPRGLIATGVSTCDSPLPIPTFARRPLPITPIASAPTLAFARSVPSTAKGEKRKSNSTNTFTVDSIIGPGEGSYAYVPPKTNGEEEEDADRLRKRKKQKKDFEGVEPIRGEGPCQYYNSPGVGTPATRIRGPSAAGRAMSAPAPAMTDMTPGAAPSSGRLPQTPFRTPFRTPFFKAVEKGRSGPILAETRKQALGSVQLAMLDRVDSLVWEYWGVESGDDNAMKEKQIKKVARAVEHELALEKYTTTDYTQAINSLIKTLKLLRIADVVRAICADDLSGEFGQGESGGMMRLVERCAKVEGAKAKAKGKGKGKGRDV